MPNTYKVGEFSLRFYDRGKVCTETDRFGRWPLAPDARCASQWVSEELVGAFANATYLGNKMAVVPDKARKDPSAEIRVEMGLTSEGNRGRPCAFMTQGQFEEVQAAVVFELEDGRIVRYDLCIPQLLGAVRKGVFPL